MNGAGCNTSDGCLKRSARVTKPGERSDTCIQDYFLPYEYQVRRCSFRLRVRGFKVGQTAIVCCC